MIFCYEIVNFQSTQIIKNLTDDFLMSLFWICAEHTKF